MLIVLLIEEKRHNNKSQDYDYYKNQRTIKTGFEKVPFRGFVSCENQPYSGCKEKSIKHTI